MSQVEIFVSELETVDGLPAGAVAFGEITALKRIHQRSLREDRTNLYHEFGYNTMHARVLVKQGLIRCTEAFLSGAKSSEVLGSQWTNI